MKETNEHEEFIAIAWFSNFYDEDNAKRTCEIQGLSFQNVKEHYKSMIKGDDDE